MTVSRNLIYPILIAFLVVLIYSSTSLSNEPILESSAVKSDSGGKRPKITISKETTYLTGPLRADGTVDYLAALNRRCSEGVTPENNAAVPFWRAVGPKSLDKKIRKRFFELLGIEELPEEGEYLVSFNVDILLDNGDKKPNVDGLEDNSAAKEAVKQYHRMRTAPWKSEDCPQYSALLKRNGKLLDAIVDGTRRPRFYLPTVPEEDNILTNICISSSIVPPVREVTWQLMARAMLHLGEGNAVEAWRNILACHRFARHVSRRPLVLDRMIAMSLVQDLRPIAALVRSPDNSSAQIGEFQSQFSDLPLMSQTTEVWHFGERIFSLSFLMDIAIHKDKSLMFKLSHSLSQFCDEEGKRQLRAFNELAIDERVDWNEVFRLENIRLDQVCEAVAQPSYRKRIESCELLEREWADAAKRATDEELSRRSRASDKTSPAVKAQRLLYILHGSDLLGHSYTGSVRAEEFFEMRMDLIVLAFALERYRIDRGEYPKSLNDLKQGYIDTIPKDRFADNELRYRPEGDQYLLYSVGFNGKDDGGRNFTEEHDDWSDYESATEEEKSRDDIAIRMPPKKSQKKEEE